MTYRKLAPICGILGIIVMVIQSGTAQAAPGDLDPGFAGTGITKAKAFTRLSAVASGGDGHAIVVGATGDKASPDILVGRYLADGTLDGSFGSAGLRRVDIGAADVASDVAVAADGSIWVGGSADGRFLVMRLTPDGALDSSFNGTGFLIDAGRDIVSELASASSGRVVAIEVGGYRELSVIRLLPDGSPDQSFGDGGVRVVPIEATSQHASVAIAGDDSLVVGGAEVARLSPAGQIDQSFGQGGHAGAGGTGLDAAESIALSPTGEILIGLRVCSSEHGCGSRLVRLAADGRTTTPIASDIGSRIALETDGSVLVAGERAARGLPSTMALSRISTSGESVPAFGIGGRGLAYAGLKRARTTDLALAADNSAIVIGEIRGGSPVIAAFSLGPGNADADADGVLDRRDGCRRGYAANRSGCRSVARRLRIGRDDGEVRVRVRSRTGACVHRTRVVLFAKRPGTDRRVGSEVVDAFRSDKVRFAAPRGASYYAIARARSTDLARCLRSRSGALQF